ncbi:beta-eliminating lyase-related protein [Leifsonia sp. NPDC080035]|uniref:Beta-eliminating lyase-related protein n=1 Tax=Leifsonia sp. NPDC080035 TaxID=3143936 RepID=A0AAU7G7N6_9MICO
MTDSRQRLWSASRGARRLLSNERPVTAAERLAALAASPHAAHLEPLDAYGDGIVGRLEGRVGALLGTPAALWFPTGIMAQQAVMQVWAARAGTRRVAVHPLQHTQLQEEDGFAVLSRLEPVHPTIERRHPTAAELDAMPGPLAAVVVELPLQELGYVLPTWDQFVELASVARRRGVPLHVDGARIWETQHAFGRPLPEIVSHASSISVSLYKAVGGLSGAAIAGEEDLIAEARVWRTRFGGDVFRQFPAIVAALDGLDTRLDRVPLWAEHAAVVAEGLRAVPGLRVTPDPPHIGEFWVYADLRADAINRAVLEDLEATGERWLHGWWTDDGGRAVAEVTLRDEALAWTADDVAEAGRRVLRRAAR